MLTGSRPRVSRSGKIRDRVPLSGNHLAPIYAFFHDVTGSLLRMNSINAEKQKALCSPLLQKIQTVGGCWWFHSSWGPVFLLDRWRRKRKRWMQLQDSSHQFLMPGLQAESQVVLHASILGVGPCCSSLLR